MALLAFDRLVNGSQPWKMRLSDALVDHYQSLADIPSTLAVSPPLPSPPTVCAIHISTCQIRGF